MKKPKYPTRLSMREPNLQNIPIRTEVGRAIKEAFKFNVPISVDYSKIEARISKEDLPKGVKRWAMRIGIDGRMRLEVNGEACICLTPSHRIQLGDLILNRSIISVAHCARVGQFPMPLEIIFRRTDIEQEKEKEMNQQKKYWIVKKRPDAGAITLPGNTYQNKLYASQEDAEHRARGLAQETGTGYLVLEVVGCFDVTQVNEVPVI